MKNSSTLLSTKLSVEGDIIHKEYTLKTILPEYKEKIGDLIFDYYQNLSRLKFPLPKLIKRKDLIFTFEKQGQNIIELAQENIEDFYFSNSAVFDKILDIVKLAQENNLSIDPHIKNFTINKSGDIFYVDIFPPHGKEYWNILLKSNPNNEQNITKTINLFKPSMLAHHFLADFMSTYNNQTVIEDLTNLMIEKGMIKNYEAEKVNHILEVEKEVKGPKIDRYDNVS